MAHPKHCSLLVVLILSLARIAAAGESSLKNAADDSAPAPSKQAKADKLTGPVASAPATKTSSTKPKATKPVATSTPAASVPAPAVQSVPDEEARAEIVPLPPLKKGRDGTFIATSPKTAFTLPVARGPSALQAKEPGYNTVLSGVLDFDMELGAAQSPVLVRGTLVIAEGVTVTLKPGAIVHLKADPNAEKPAQADSAAAGLPDPTQNGAIWVWGSMQGQGVTGNPAEILGQDKAPAALLLYGTSHSRVEGVRLKNLNVTQSAGVWQWTNCELVSVGYYALAGGGGLFTHCTLRTCGGIFATYNRAPWSLLARKNVFESCREGIVLGSNPGEARLLVEKNNFVKTRGAHIRAMPVTDARTVATLASSQKDGEGAKLSSADAARKAADKELEIGENWYGTNILEDVEARLVDRRVDPSVSTRLNTRPPAEQPYANIGAGALSTAIAATLREQQNAVQKILQAHPAPVSTTNTPLSKGLGGGSEGAAAASVPAGKDAAKDAAAPVMSRSTKTGKGK
ncbi:MAG TPA: hypothetical protein VGP72_33020 [Planctomycetota bacterium]|jgi:hypothetical protein